MGEGSQRGKQKKIFWALIFSILIISLGIALAIINFEPQSFIIDGPVGGRYPFRRIEIESYEWDSETGQIKLYVRYLKGIRERQYEEGIDLEKTILLEAYMNDTLDDAVVFNPQVLENNQTSEITLSKTYTAKPFQIKAKVITADGLEDELIDPYYKIRIEDVNWVFRTAQIKVFVKNYGNKEVTLAEVYVNETLDESAIAIPIVLAVDQIAEITLSGKYTDTHIAIPIKVATLEEASSERSSPIFAIWIQSINWNSRTGKISAFVYSNGYDDATIFSVYVNGILDGGATVRPSMSLREVTLSKTYENCPSQVTLKVVTLDGAVAELTQHPNEYTGRNFQGTP